MCAHMSHTHVRVYESLCLRVCAYMYVLLWGSMKFVYGPHPRIYYRQRLQTRMHIHTQAHTHTYTYTRQHPHTRTHARTRTLAKNTKAHTHTNA